MPPLHVSVIDQAQGETSQLTKYGGSRFGTVTVGIIYCSPAVSDYRMELASCYEIFGAYSGRQN